MPMPPATKTTGAPAGGSKKKWLRGPRMRTAAPAVATVVDGVRAAATVDLTQHGHPVARPVGRVAAQRVLAFQGRAVGTGQQQVDVRTGLPRRQLASVRGHQLELDDVLGDGADVGDEAVPFDVAEHAGHQLSWRSWVRSGADAYGDPGTARCCLTTNSRYGEPSVDDHRCGVPPA